MAFTSLNSLSAFVAVARLLSYAGAAKQLGVSTSALSQSVRQLEERLEVTLLARTSRSVALTEAGERLLASAGPAVDQAFDSLKAVKAKRGEVRGRLRLSVPSAAATLILDRALPKLVERHPKVELEVRVEDRMVNIVTEGFDAGIRLVEAIDRDMVHVRLSPATRLVVVGAPAYLERHGVPKEPTDLLQHECIGVRWSANAEPWAWELERGKKVWRVPVRGAVTTNDSTLRKSLALKGVGLCYSLEPLVAEDIARGQLRIVLEAFAPKVPGLFLYYPSRAQVSPALKAFVDVAREVTREPAGKR